MKSRLFYFALVLVFLFSSSATAQQQVVVIPLFGSGKKLNNVVTVLPTGGDFTNPVAAINSINGASASNRFLVIIGPGTYTLAQPLIMKPYVDVLGSGMNTTELAGALSSASIGNSSAVVIGASHARLKDLSVRNSGGGDYSIGIYNSGVNNSYFERLDVQAWGSSAGAYGTGGSYGIYNSGGSAVTITDSLLYGGGRWAAGVYNDNSSPTLNRVHAEAKFPEWLSDVGGAHGIISTNSSNPQVRYSVISGDSYGFQQSGGQINVSYSTIKNLIDTGNGSVQECVHCDNGNGQYIHTDCYTVFSPAAP